MNQNFSTDNLLPSDTPDQNVALLFHVLQMSCRKNSFNNLYQDVNSAFLYIHICCIPCIELRKYTKKIQSSLLYPCCILGILERLNSHSNVHTKKLTFICLVYMSRHNRTQIVGPTQITKISLHYGNVGFKEGPCIWSPITP